ncbi:heme lyase CcmF/NrfE family subunit [Vulgatibacter sp.]|uniref:heme lyase CcmF/NrfE family subunit n=1 Tax=Vulgatibacter sp. TaxID=1971226 RepID=UPI00356A105F
MNAILGQTLVLLALLTAAVGSVLGFTSGFKKNDAALQWARRMAYAFSALMIGANVLMVYALLTHDFSVSYVAQVGSRATPTWVTVVSLWSSLEGSILFWGAILGLYVGGAVYWSRNKHPEVMPWALGILLACSVFFAFLIAGPANPFHVVPNPPADGPGANPLLQNHILMVVHPPALYLGYVGMTVPFAFAVAALMAGRLGPDLLKSLRQWLLVPWMFLTVGIVLGGWWAYEVLGWGGYWAWDPVENASLLPWLTATAAVHSILVVERKGILKGWTVTLVLATFLLTILGTFMTRSGVFNSVHSFTQSDIGPTFLGFLGFGLVFSVLLLAARIGTLEAEGRIDDAKSRESFFLVQNLIFVGLTFTVLIGTVFPLIVEAVKGVQISVGEPYFNRMAIPLGVALLFVMGIGPALPWGRSSRQEAVRAVLPPLAGAAVVTAIGVALGARSPWLILTLLTGGYTLQVTLKEMFLPVRQRLKGGRNSLGQALTSLVGPGRRRFGGYVVHLGVVLVMVAIGVSSTHKVTAETTLPPGGSTTLGPYTLTFLGTQDRVEPHRRSTIAQVEVKKGTESLGILEPAMNHYFTRREPIGTPAVHSTVKEDIYLSMMSIDGKGNLGLRAFLEPMVGWIWFGTAIIVLGSLLSMWPRRSLATASARSRQPVAAGGPAPDNVEPAA